MPIWLAARWPNRRPVARALRHDGVFLIDTDDPAGTDRTFLPINLGGNPFGWTASAEASETVLDAFLEAKWSNYESDVPKAYLEPDRVTSQIAPIG